MKDRFNSWLLLIAVLIAALSTGVFIATNLSIFFISWRKEVGTSLTSFYYDYLHLLLYLQLPAMSFHPHFISMSESAMRHFGDVKRLLLLNEGMCILSWLLVRNSYKKIDKQKQLIQLILLINFLCILLLSLGVILFINFDTSFLQFHRMLFHNVDWVFNPKTDPIIYILTPAFFGRLFLLFGTINILILLIFRRRLYKKLLMGKFRT